MVFGALTIIHVPKKVNWEKFMREGTNEWKCQKAVCQLFDERPIWIKQSLSEHLSKKGLKFGPNLFKRCVQNKTLSMIMIQIREV